LRDRTDVLFYFTGLATVRGLDTLRFLPGAIADHLTSAGGILTGHDQMSVLRWLDAGATASYGAVIEPCNFQTKFPQPAVVIARYARGERLIEAYWKSVAWPGQGVFVGEPLAAPFRAPLR
ncbi:MAG TPA: TIGR03790 family protein, partial [Candidatus Eisenbacteria bacterium]|nr:TIGR03790 family protein [Candidatus Eisenbacteria bacterium]